MTLKKKQNETFKGFMIMADMSGKHGCGQFKAADGSEDIAKTIDCKDLGKGKSNTASHSSNTEKSEVSLIWTPPSNHKGKVRNISKIFYFK